MNISGKGWRAGPPARRAATPRAGPKKTAHFALTGQPGPAHLKRAKNGPGQNGPGWPVLTPLMLSNSTRAFLFKQFKKEFFFCVSYINYVKYILFLTFGYNCKK